MPAHGGMPVEARRLRVEARAREEIPKYDVTPEHRSADYQRRRPVAEYAPANLDRFADGPDFRRGIERGADLVVNNRCAAGLERLEGRRQFALHLCRRHRPRAARDAEGAQAGEPGQLLIGRRREKQNRAKTRPRGGFHYVGRSGEVIAVVSEQQPRGAAEARKRRGRITFLNGRAHSGFTRRLRVNRAASRISQWFRATPDGTSHIHQAGHAARPLPTPAATRASPLPAPSD